MARLRSGAVAVVAAVLFGLAATGAIVWLRVTGRGQLAAVVAAAVLGAAAIASAFLAARRRRHWRTLAVAAVLFGLAATGTIIVWLVGTDRRTLAFIVGAAGVGAIAVITSLFFKAKNSGAEVARDAGIALLTGAALGLVIYPVENERADQAERVENLRFVRDIATQADRFGAFRDLDLENMNLSGLEFPCGKFVDDNTEKECIERSADFTDADLPGANMTLMDLSGADFTNADLRNADLRYSDVTGTNLDKAKLDGAKLGSICQSESTKWPTDSDFEPPPRQELGGSLCRELVPNVSEEEDGG